MPGKTSAPSPPENLSILKEAIFLYMRAKDILSPLPEYTPDRKKLAALREARECLDLLARVSKK
jgi:hypothetical protein